MCVCAYIHIYTDTHTQRYNYFSAGAVSKGIEFLNHRTSVQNLLIFKTTFVEDE